MSHKIKTETETEPEIDNEDIPLNITAMIQEVLNHKLFISLGTLIGVIASVVFAVLQPDYFSAQIKMMPPTSSSSGGAQAAILGALGGAAGGAAASALGIKNPGDLYVGLLKTRTVLDEIIGQFKLQTVYDLETQEHTRIKLMALTKVNVGKDGIIAIEVEDQDPKQAANIANAYFASLQKLMQRMAKITAVSQRSFFETQLKQAKNQLTDAEEAFKTMQQTTGVLQLDAQGKVAIEGVARTRALISAKEVEIAAVQQYATPENPDYQRRATELSALRQELNKLERSQTGAAAGEVASVGGKKLTESGLEYMRRVRELKYAETLFELIAKQFEFARLDEARDAATLQLIDEAIPPELKSRPKRALLIVGGGLLSLLLMLGWVLLRSRRRWLS